MKQLGLSEQTGEAVAPLVEYEVDGEPWRCERFDWLSAEMELSRQALPLFHAVALGKARGWLIVRRLFGLAPLLPPPNADLDDLRLWEREELRAKLGVTRPQLQAELDAIRGAWRAQRPKAETERVASPPGPVREEFHFGQEAFLREHGFELRWRNQAEGEWFAGRVKDYGKILKEPFAAVLARNALMAELRIRQLDEMLNNAEEVRPGSKDWKELLKLRQDLDRNYQEQLEQLKKLCPWAGAIAGKHSFQGVISEITEAYQKYYAHGDNQLLDGIFTKTEVEVECRRSVQTPEPRYRAGLVVYLNAAKAALWDPHWKPTLTAGQLKKLDAGWKAATAAAGEEAGEPVPDLEQEGQEFEKIEDPQ